MIVNIDIGDSVLTATPSFLYMLRHAFAGLFYCCSKEDCFCDHIIRENKYCPMCGSQINWTDERGLLNTKEDSGLLSFWKDFDWKEYSKRAAAITDGTSPKGGGQPKYECNQ